MAKPVDAADLKSAGRKAVGVQVPLPPSDVASRQVRSGRQQLELELEQAMRHGRWLADDELAALDAVQQQRGDAVQVRRKVWLLTGFCALIPPLWPLALVLVLHQLFPRTTRRYGVITAVVLLVGGGLLLLALLALVVAVLMALF